MYAPNSRGKQEESLRRGFQRSNTAFYDAVNQAHSPPPLLQGSAARYPRFDWRGYLRDIFRLRETSRHKLKRPFEASGVEVVYTKDVFEAESWLKTNIVDCSARAVGFETEWKPQSVSKKDGGIESKTAVLQLGVETSCLVLHIYHMSKLPKSLISILRDENILKVGVGIKEDVLKLHRDKGLVCEGMADIQAMAMKSLGIPASAPKLGLKALAERFLDIELEKPKEITTSNWENFPLQLRQIEYAALDAWAGLKIYQAIIKRQLVTGESILLRSRGHVNTVESAVVYVLWFTLFVLLFYVLPRYYIADKVNCKE